MAARDTLHDPSAQLCWVSFPCPSRVRMACSMYPVSLFIPRQLETNAHGGRLFGFESRRHASVSGVIL
jgi:hypothetical protein